MKGASQEESESETMMKPEPGEDRNTFEKVTTICDIIDNSERMPKRSVQPCKAVGPEILLQEPRGENETATIVKKYGNIDKVVAHNPLSGELNNFLIYGNESPVSYFLNGYNTALVTFGAEGSCKSRLLFSKDIEQDLASKQSLVSTVVEEVLRYVDEKNKVIKGSQQAYALGLSLADVIYSDADKTEVLSDFLRVRDNDNANAELDALTNVQIT